MKKIILFLTTITFLSAKIVDLGTTGEIYPIKEENFMDMIKKEINNLNINEKEIQEKIKKEVFAQSIGTTDLPYGEDVKQYKEKNYQILPEDIRNQYGKIYKRAGESVLLDTKVPLDICFVDGTNLSMLKNQIEYFDKVVEKKSNSKIGCVYMVSNRSVLELNKLYSPRIFYPSKKAYEDRFMVKSIPTYVHIYRFDKEFYSFPINMFKDSVIKK